jgi:lipopolysaccharide export LptBFGC system permease protein LptF
MKEVVREDFHGCFGIFTYLVGVHTGLPIAVAATAALLQLPYFAVLSMPMACLAASLFGLGRLQADMETVAIFSAGVSLWRMLVSPLCLGFVAVLLKLVCHECLIPYGSSQYETHHCLLFMLLYEPL